MNQNNSKGRGEILKVDMAPSVEPGAGAFDAAANGKMSAMSNARGERFTVKQAEPDQAYNPYDGIGHANVKGQDSVMNSRKERFVVEQAAVSNDEPVGESAFEHALKDSGLTHAFQAGEPGGASRADRWITTKDGVATPVENDKPGAFDNALSANKPSAMMSNNRPVRTPVEQAGPEMYSDGNTGSLAASVNAQNKPSSNFSNNRAVRTPVKQAGPTSSGSRPSAFKGF